MDSWHSHKANRVEYHRINIHEGVVFYAIEAYWWTWSFMIHRINQWLWKIVYGSNLTMPFSFRDLRLFSISSRTALETLLGP